jgi:acetyl esterase/lipase
MLIVLVFALDCILVMKRRKDQLSQMMSPIWVHTTYDIPYGPQPENRLDILKRRWNLGSKKRPAVIIFHGGNWQYETRKELLVRVCHRYLEHGFIVVNAEYRKGAIAPAVEDAIKVLQWFSSRAPEYGADQGRIVIMGESAGAHLAMMAAFRAGVHVAAVVNFYGVSDLVPLLGRSSIKAVLPATDMQKEARALSPLTYIRYGLPPVFSIHGTADEIVPQEQTAILTKALIDAGGEAFAFYLEGGKHGLSKEHQKLAYVSVFDFLRQHGILD